MMGKVSVVDIGGKPMTDSSETTNIQGDMSLHGCFADTKQEANEKRRAFKKMGRCSCYTKARSGSWYVTSCKERFNFCNPKRNKK